MPKYKIKKTRWFIGIGRETYTEEVKPTLTETIGRLLSGRRKQAKTQMGGTVADWFAEFGAPKPTVQYQKQWEQRSRARYPKYWARKDALKQR